MHDISVRSGDVSLAVRDHGGDGTPVLLLHGAGGNLLTWGSFPQRLTGSHRVLALDLRGHGHSDDGPFTVDNLLSDVAAVIGHFGLEEVTVAGHSLGGIIAALWASEHPDGPAAVSFDGVRSALTHPDHYADLPPEQVLAGREKLRAAFDGQEAALGNALPDDALEAMRSAQRQAFPDESDADFEALFQRGLTTRNGRTYARPKAEVLGQMRQFLNTADAVPVLAAVQCPFLVVHAGRGFGPMMPELAPLMAAHRAGLRRDLGDLTATNPGVTVVEVDATHNLVAEIPAELATLTLDFLARSRTHS